jgi:hypothetical protein
MAKLKGEEIEQWFPGTGVGEVIDSQGVVLRGIGDEGKHVLMVIDNTHQTAFIFFIYLCIIYLSMYLCIYVSMYLCIYVSIYLSI